MNGYRIYFLNEQRSILGAHRFEADDDETALWIAGRLHDACSDMCNGFELWHMARRIGGDDGPVRPPGTLETVNLRRQQMLVSVEETLRDSASRIAASRRLLKSLERAKPMQARTPHRPDLAAYMRDKAAQFRLFARRYETPVSPKLLEIADELEQHAVQMEQRENPH